MKSGWVAQNLGSLTTKIGSGATPLGGEHAYQATGIPLIRSLNVYDDGFREAKLARLNDQQAERLSNVIVQEGDVLLNITGASVARCCVAPGQLLPARVNQHVSILRPKKELLDSNFLHYLLISRDYKGRLLQTGEDGGSTRQAITKAQLQSFRIEFPNELREQQRIVGILDEAFEGIATAKANAERNVANARALFESHLDTVFTQRGPDWVEKTLEEIGRTQTGSTPSTSQRSNYGDYIPFVKPGDFNEDGTLDYNKARLSQSGAAGARIVAADSAFMVCIGATIGKCGYSGQDVTMNQQVNALTPRDGSSTRFIYYQWLTNAFQQRVLYASGQATLPIINKSKWSALTMWLPSKPKVQERIVVEFDELLSETQRLAAIFENKLEALDALKKSLLHHAFTGQL